MFITYSSQEQYMNADTHVGLDDAPIVNTYTFSYFTNQRFNKDLPLLEVVPTT